MRFLADMGVAMRVVEWLRSQGHDAVHLREGAVLSTSGDALNRGAILIVEETRHRIRYLPVREAEP